MSGGFYILLCGILFSFKDGCLSHTHTHTPPVRWSIIVVLGYRSSGLRTDPGPPPHCLHSIENHKQKDKVMTPLAEVREGVAAPPSWNLGLGKMKTILKI